jgi:hypothetical protein
VDAYVLAWIASQVRFHSPQSKYNGCPVPINLAITAARWSSRLAATAEDRGQVGWQKRKVSAGLFT